MEVRNPMFEDETTPKADAATKWFFQMIFFLPKKYFFFCKIILVCLVNRKEIPVKTDIFEEKNLKVNYACR